MDNFFEFRQVKEIILCQLDSDEKFKKVREIYQKFEPNGVKMIEIPEKKILILHSKNLSKSKNDILRGGKNLKFIEELKNQRLIMNSLQAYSPTGNFSHPLIFPTGDIFLLFRQEITEDKCHSIIEKFKGKIVKKYPKLPIFQIRMPIGEEYKSLKIAKAFKDKDEILCATPDFHCLLQRPSKDSGSQFTTMLSDCIHPDGPSTPIFQLSYVERAWEFGTSGHGVIVIDQGFFNHPEINFSFDYAYDSVRRDNDPMNPPDDNTHGTELSSVIGNKETSNSGYPHGVSSGTSITPMRLTGSIIIDGETDFVLGRKTWIDIFVQIVESKVRIVNYSFHPPFDEVLESRDVRGWFNWMNWYSHINKGVFWSVSSGNCPSGERPITPIARNPTTFAVGLANRDLEEPIGKIGIGLDISVPDGAWSVIDKEGNPTTEVRYGHGGTSVAAAIVSGTAALILKQGNYSSREIAEIIRRTARRSPKYEITADEDGHSLLFGYGFLDAFAAVKQAHKGFHPAGRVRSIRFDDGYPLYTLIEILDIPSFWCLVLRTDNEGIYWGHWVTKSLWNTDIEAGIIPHGKGLIIGDFNGNGCDEIAVQQAGLRNHHFTIIYYDLTQKKWFKMGLVQDSEESAFVWDPKTIRFEQVFGADIDGDGVIELIASRQNCIDMAKFNIAENKWERFGPPMYSPELADYQLIERGKLVICKTKVLKSILKKIHRNDLNCDLILVTAVIRVKLGIKINNRKIVKRVENHTFCSLQRYLGTSWQPQQIDRWGTTHIPIPYTRKIIIADIDGDGTDEVVYIYNSPEKRIIVLDFAEPFPTSESQHGYLKIYSEWQWDGEPDKIVSGDFNGDGKDELAYFNSNNQTDEVHFLKWNPKKRQWKKWKTLSRKKLGNPAIKMVAGDFDDDGKAEIGLLLEKPFANTYHVYKYINTQFQWVGDL